MQNLTDLVVCLNGLQTRSSASKRHLTFSVVGVPSRIGQLLRIGYVEVVKAAVGGIGLGLD